MKKLYTYPAKPFVKWVGGKTQLLDDIKKFLPSDLSQRNDVTYIEPFVGGGAVLFWILQEYPNITKAIINDINEELICTYRVIKSDVENLILELTRIQTEYLALDNVERKNYFLFQRNRFNEKNNSDVKTAALLIFLNRTCFNGLYRVNSKGKFNVPYGKYTNPKICDEETLRADSAILQRVEVLCGDFAQTGKYAGDNVLYYFDPPYLITNAPYNSNWNIDDEKDLLNLLDDLNDKGIKFALSNVILSNGKENTLLKEWSKKYITLILKRQYRNANYQKKNITDTIEVLIKNY